MTSALVTGAGSGIGRALALALADRGVHVYAADVDWKGLRDLGGSVTALELDVTDRGAVEAAIDRVVEDHGRIDLLFNNAGIVVGGDFEDMDERAWQRIVDVNLWGVVHGTQHGYRVMLRQGGGHIVNTASTAGVLPVARSTAYAATKHAVVGLSTSLRQEAAAKGVKVSVVVPGLVDTGIFDSATNVGGHDYAAAMDRVPLRKVTPERAAAAILRGVDRNDPFIVFPFYNRVLTRLHRLVPSVMATVINRGRDAA